MAERLSSTKSLLEQIQRDLRPFADPGTTITWTESSRAFSAEWESRGKKLAATFSPKAKGGISVAFEGQNFTYEQFLSHSAIGDVLGLARMILQSAEKQIFITTRASDVSNRTASALAIINDTLDNQAEAQQISVVFITGDAGTGKTSVLKELVRNKAEQYVKGLTTTVYFYVNAQGRALARLDEALAVTLQDLRASLTYSALPALVRNGIVVPVVDGFDELLGVTGYDDAFASLRRFIDDLEVQGRIVAAARSTYYEQEFVSRATAVPQPWELFPVRVLEWEETEFKDYLDARYRAEPGVTLSKKEFSAHVRKFFEDPAAAALRGKPFFVAKSADLTLRGGVSQEGGTLIDQLVGEYVERDRTEKLVDTGRSPVLTRPQIESLFVFVAEEMWLQETRELDLVSIREVAEVLLEEETIPQSARERVIQRMPTSAFLKVGRTTNRVEFEHEALLSYFLSRGVANAMKKGPDTARSFLMRGLLPPYCPQFAAVLLRKDNYSLGDILKTTNAASDTHLPRANRVKENSGALVAASMRDWKDVLRAHTHSPIHVIGTVFAGESFSGLILHQTTFENVEFRRTDFSGAQFFDCNAPGSTFYEVLVDVKSTRLEIKGIDPSIAVAGLRVRDNGDIKSVYAVKEVALVLSRLGADVPIVEERETYNVSHDVVDVIETLMRSFVRANVIWPTDNRYSKLIRDRNWSEVRRQLVQNGIIASESRDHKGTTRESLRRKFDPSEVLAGYNLRSDAPLPIKNFWESIEASFPPRQ